MSNKLSFLYFNYLFLNSILQDRLFKFSPLFFFNNIKLYFLLKNESNNRFLFILKLMLIEKCTNNKVQFIYNANLLKKKKMKVGGFLCISKQKFYNYLLSFFYYSLPKLIYSIDIKNNNYYLFYDLKAEKYSIFFFLFTKFLFFNFFSFNLDYYKYYNFFENSIYKLKFKVSTCYKYYLVNRDIFRLVGLNII
jgi:hypothetical protein